MTDMTTLTDLLNKALENPGYILLGIGFILLCIFLGLLERKYFKANPGAYLYHAFNAAQNNTAGSVVINGQSHHVTRAGNTTYIN